MTDRMTDWRQFRAALVGMSEQQQLAAVASYWAKAPLSIVADPEHWPTIWQMMQANIWSRNSVAIGMEATLRLAGMAAARMTLRLIRDGGDDLLVLVIDDTWVLNYDWGSYRLYTIDHQQIICEWRFVDRDYFIVSD